MAHSPHRVNDYSRLAGSLFALPQVPHFYAVVAGAGALGNEVVKALGLAGVERVVVVDPDVVEHGNLSRSIFFRLSDVCGHNKAAALAETAQRLFPDTEFRALPSEIADVGFGDLADADILFSCVDSDLARLEIARISTRLGVPVSDGGMQTYDCSQGRVSWFPGKSGACFACKLSSRRRRELLLYSTAEVGTCDGETPAGVYPSTPTMAALVGSLQVELGLRSLVQLEPESTTFEISLHSGPRVENFRTPRGATCPFHEERQSLVPLPEPDAPLETLFDSVDPPPGSTAFVALDWPISTRVHCLACGREWAPMQRCALLRRRGVCPGCGSGSILEQESIRTVQPQSHWSSLARSALGLPENHLYSVRFHSGER